MNCPGTDFCLFALVFIFRHQFLAENGTEQVSVSAPLSGYNTSLSITLVAIFRSWRGFCWYLEVSSAGKWAHHPFAHEGGKLKDIWKEVVGMMILRSVEPRQLSRAAMLSTDSQAELPFPLDGAFHDFPVKVQALPKERQVRRLQLVSDSSLTVRAGGGHRVIFGERCWLRCSPAPSMFCSDGLSFLRVRLFC